MCTVQHSNIPSQYSSRKKVSCRTLKLHRSITLHYTKKLVCQCVLRKRVYIHFALSCPVNNKYQHFSKKYTTMHLTCRNGKNAGYRIELLTHPYSAYKKY